MRTLRGFSFTRTNAVVCLTERFDESADALPQTISVGHHWLVLHNPYSKAPVSDAACGAWINESRRHWHVGLQ
jgi:hypothetical protein